MQNQNSQNPNLNSEKENVAFSSPVIPAQAGIQAPVVLLMLFFGIVLLFLGIFLGRTYFSGKQNSTSAVPTPITVTPTTTEATSGASLENWKTYKNEKYGFEFKYPSNFSIKNDVENMIGLFNSEKKMEPGYFFKVKNQTIDDFLSSYIKKDLVDNSNVKPEVYILSGVNGTKIITESAMGTIMQHIFIRKDPYSYIISGPSYPNSEMNLQFSQILSTFKFTEKTDQTSNWQSYKNSKIGYQLKYPNDWILKEAENDDSIQGKPVKYIIISTPEKKYSLHFGFKKKNDIFLVTDRTGVGAGDIQKSGEAIKIINSSLLPELLIFDNKVKEVFYHQPRDDKERDNYEFIGYFSFNALNVNAIDNNDMKDSPYLDQVAQILESVSVL